MTVPGFLRGAVAALSASPAAPGLGRVKAGLRLLRARAGELLLALVLTEILARFVLGLGTPPLWVAHPTIEYLQQPNQDLYRFGRHFLVNEWGMRSSSLSEHKPAAAREYRVLVFGDSVINGGALTAHEDLATSIAEQSLTPSRERTVRVLNISAGSWGPGNLLAYVEAYGLFDADLMITLLSSHDAADVPTFAPLDPQINPTQPPLLAVEEGVRRYLGRYVRRYVPNQKGPQVTDAAPVVTQADINAATGDLRRLIHKARDQGLGVRALLHPTQSELGVSEADRSKLERGHHILKRLYLEESVPVTDLRPLWLRARDAGHPVYRDEIHLSVSGQAELAPVLAGLVREAMASKH